MEDRTSCDNWDKLKETYQKIMIEFRDRNSYTRAELVDIAGELGFCFEEEDGDNLDVDLETWRQGIVAGRSIVLSVDHLGEVLFTVDGFTAKASDRKISLRDGADILSWFLAAWNDLITDLDPTKTYYCYPEAGDGFYLSRVKRYQSIGFELVSADRMELNQSVFAASRYLNNWVKSRRVAPK